ncbi:zf-HC2 domain-containing protein [Streptomyces sp. NPDC001678]|uniref:zf-HC2 domain-containing protein n=1 Tax=Streptomyces sp. NPDC001678 TaxID=3364599 RepID=UPI0036A44B7B
MNRPAPHHEHPSRDDEHTAVGAYALGVLDEADTARFEEHLADCPRCAAELEALMGLTPLLGELKEATPDPAALAPEPRPELLDRLLDDVTVTRRAQRTRRLWLVAAAVALIVAGPLAGAALTSQDTGQGHTGVSAAKQMYDEGEKYGGVTDPVTHVNATVSLQDKAWGTHVALKLGNVKGPLTCDLVAVGKNGREQVATTWAVPEAGYGIEKGDKESKGDKGSKDTSYKEPLYTHGGVAFNEKDIARFEIRTLDGKHLATVTL